MSKYLLLILCAVIALPAMAVDLDKISSQEFLDLLRRPHGFQTWGQMSGRIDHERQGSKKTSSSVYLATMFAPDRMISQVIVDDKQGYTISQTFDGAKSGTTVTPMEGSAADSDLLGQYGLRAEDLTMSFIYWDFVKELPRETITFRNCRVFVLTKGDEYVRLSVNVEYLFPMEVRWYKDKFDENAVAYRSLKATKFTEVNDLWLVTRLQLEGPGWRTRVDFTKVDADSRDKRLPKDLLRDSVK